MNMSYISDIVYIQQWLTRNIAITEVQATAKERTQYAFYDGTGFQFWEIIEIQWDGKRNWGEESFNTIENTNCFSFIQHTPGRAFVFENWFFIDLA